MFSTAVRESLKSELVKELTEGELDRKRCRRLKKMLAAAEQFLMLDKVDAPEVHDDADDDGNNLPPYVGGMVGGYARGEDMQMRMIREVVEMLPALLNRRESPAQLVVAIAEAKALGLDDVAESLKARLMGTNPATALARHQDNAPNNPETTP